MVFPISTTTAILSHQTLPHYPPPPHPLVLTEGHPYTLYEDDDTKNVEEKFHACNPTVFD